MKSLAALSTLAITVFAVGTFAATPSQIKQSTKAQIVGRFVMQDGLSGLAVPAPNVSAELVSSDRKMAMKITSDRNGRFFATVEAGSYTLVVTDLRFEPVRKTIVVRSAERKSVLVGLKTRS